MERAIIDFWILSSFCGSVKAVASSKITIGAFFKIALAIAIRCFSPPESRLPASPAGVSYPFSSRTMKSSQQAAFAAAYTSSSVAFGLPKRMFSLREQLNRKLSCVTKLTNSESCRMESSLIFVPPMEMLPPVTSQNRAIRRATVDLPPPDGPTRAVKLPCGIFKLMSCNTSFCSVLS